MQVYSSNYKNHLHNNNINSTNNNNKKRNISAIINLNNIDDNTPAQSLQ